MHTDPIADLLTRIRNAINAGHETVVIPHSKMKLSILQVLKEKGFIDAVEEVKSGQFPELKVMLKDDIRRLTLKRISTPGQRIYVKKGDMKSVKSGLGITIVSTSKGVMSGLEAKKQNLGGELICEIY